jgi:hypothetical protein
MGRPQRRKEFDHTSQGGAWAAEGVSNGRGFTPAKEHPSNRSDKEKSEAPKPRRIFGL